MLGGNERGGGRVHCFHLGGKVGAGHLGVGIPIPSV